MRSDRTESRPVVRQGRMVWAYEEEGGYLEQHDATPEDLRSAWDHASPEERAATGLVLKGAETAACAQCHDLLDAATPADLRSALEHMTTEERAQVGWVPRCWFSEAVVARDELQARIRTLESDNECLRKRVETAETERDQARMDLLDLPLVEQLNEASAKAEAERDAARAELARREMEMRAQGELMALDHDEVRKALDDAKAPDAQTRAERITQLARQRDAAVKRVENILAELVDTRTERDAAFRRAESRAKEVACVEELCNSRCQERDAAVKRVEALTAERDEWMALAERHRDNWDEALEQLAGLRKNAAKAERD